MSECNRYNGEMQQIGYEVVNQCFKIMTLRILKNHDIAPGSGHRADVHKDGKLVVVAINVFFMSGPFYGQFRCTSCPKSFNRAYKLTEHFERDHNFGEEKRLDSQFDCRFCDFEFLVARVRIPRWMTTYRCY